MCFLLHHITTLNKEAPTSPSKQLHDCCRLVLRAELYLVSDRHSLDLELLVHKDLPGYFELSMFKSAIYGIALTQQ